MRMNFRCQFVSVAVLLSSLIFQQAITQLPTHNRDTHYQAFVMVSQEEQFARILWAGAVVISCQPHYRGGLHYFTKAGVLEAYSTGTDCTEIFAAVESATNGIYTIQPETAPQPFEVFCERYRDGGWTVIQRRNGKGLDGKPVNFRRFWADYQRGFGHVGYEHWLGLDYMHALTQQRGKTCQLRADMTKCNGERGFAFYDAFQIGNESEFYRIALGNFAGNAGDAFRGNRPSGNQDGHYFSTSDEDHDDCTVCFQGGQAYRSCARDLYGSGWWFSNCGMANLNGDWHSKAQCEGWLSGVYWATWDPVNSLIFSELKVKCTLL